MPEFAAQPVSAAMAQIVIVVCICLPLRHGGVPLRLHLWCRPGTSAVVPLASIHDAVSAPAWPDITSLIARARYCLPRRRLPQCRVRRRMTPAPNRKSYLPPGLTEAARSPHLVPSAAMSSGTLQVPLLLLPLPPPPPPHALSIATIVATKSQRNFVISFPVLIVMNTAGTIRRTRCILFSGRYRIPL